MNLNIQEVPKYVINMQTRLDRLDLFEKEAQMMFDTEVERQEGIVIPDGPARRTTSVRALMGCAHSHLSIIAEAKRRGFPHVLVMEDDCYFPAGEKAREHMERVFKNVPDDFHLAMGGVYQARMTEPANGDWLKIAGFSSTHFYVVAARAYDRILRGYEQGKHIDRWYSDFSKMNIYVPKLMFAIQRIGYSDNVKRVVDYSYMIERSGLKLLR